MKPFIFEIFVLYILVWVHKPFKQEKRLIFSKIFFKKIFFDFDAFGSRGGNPPIGGTITSLIIYTTIIV